VRRHVYDMSGPNAIRHIDGNHKLIYWKFFIHGGIVGYSWTITFLICNNNNEAATVMSAFNEDETVHVHGLPDLDSDNVDVWCYMVEQHSSTFAVITGSTHNDRMERLWHVVYCCIGVHQDCLNEIDVYCLCFVFLPRINAATRIPSLL